MADRRLARDAREPHHPADFEADEAAVRRARRQVRAAGAIEAAADLGKAQRDQQRRKPDREKRQRAPGPDLPRDVGRQQKDGAADDLIDADRGQIPAAQLATAGNRVRQVRRVRWVLGRGAVHGFTGGQVRAW